MKLSNFWQYKNPNQFLRNWFNPEVLKTLSRGEITQLAEKFHLKQTKPIFLDQTQIIDFKQTKKKIPISFNSYGLQHSSSPQVQKTSKISESAKK